MLNLESPLSSEPAPGFKPMLGRSVTASLAMAASALLSLLLLGAYAWRLDLLLSVAARRPISADAAIRSDALVKALAGASVLLLLVSAPVFILWFYRAHQNLAAFRLPPFEYTPGQAAASFFIPFVNLARPLFVMQEVWRGTDPQLPPFAVVPLSSRPVSPVVYAWWAFFLGRGVLASVGIFPVLHSTSIRALTFSTLFLIASHASEVFAAVITVCLVVLIERRQSSLAAQLQAMQAVA